MNKYYPCLIALLLLAITVGHAQQNTFTLYQVIDMARQQSPVAKRAETTRENRYWQYRFFKSDFNPQLQLVGEGPQYNNTFSRTTQPDGSIRLLTRSIPGFLCNFSNLCPGQVGE